jgi:Zn-dependent M28 family amino/carboxypeptidase
VYYLASDTLEGRGISTPGVGLAAQHIRAEFRRLGLKSGTQDGSYFQPFQYGGNSKSDPDRTLHNVIGVLEGKGDVANETIVIGAHYDHLGHGPAGSLAPQSLRGRIHPGADDNASGVAAMLELARRFASRGTPPRRRMVFIAFCAEEAGRVGSRHYASKEPIFPIRDTVAMMNFDMVGRLRGDELGIAGNESAREFGALLAGAGARSPLKLMLGGPEYPDDSDHASFASVGVPILYVCTGSHEDRHTPADTADKIDYEGLAKVVDFCEDVLDRMLVMPRPTFVPPPRKSPPTGSK